MKKIVGILQPFDMIQKVFVYDQGHQINAKECSLEDFPKVLFAFADNYEIDTINLSGPSFFVDKIQQDIKNAAITEYGYENINIVKV